jgi:protocatechuate 3,4-dioxygenase beta subunit
MDQRYRPTRRGVIRDLTGAGLGLAGARLVHGIELGEAEAATPACTLTREQEEGPYYLDLDKIRKNITEGKAGLRLDLRIKVVNSTTCKPIKNVAVDIWHADPSGVYSGFSAEGTKGKTYLRGVQLTGKSGIAAFRTLYPGWYEGRAIHIHLKAHAGGHVAHTGQLFFSDAVSDRVVKLSPYNKHAGTRTRNSTDRVYDQQGGALVRLRRRKRSSFRKGLIATIVVGIDPGATP